MSVDPIPYLVNSIVQIDEKNFVDTFPLWREEVDALLALCELPEVSRASHGEQVDVTPLEDRKIRGIVTMAMGRDLRTRIAPAAGKSHESAVELWLALDKHYKKLSGIRAQTQGGPKPASIPAFYKAHNQGQPVDLSRVNSKEESLI